MNGDDQPSESAQPSPVDLDVIGSEAPEDLSADPSARQERVKLFGEPKRQEQFRQVLHYCRLAILTIALVALALLFTIRILHFVLPENNVANAGRWLPHGWLTAAQLDSLDKFIFGAIGAFVAEYSAKALISGIRRS
jgi:hypothetical protein